MFKELVELAERNRKKEEKNGNEIHNAITTERFACHIVIDRLGNFKDIIPIEGIANKAQRIIGNKSGKIRLLLDKLEETLGITLNSKGDNRLRKKHAWYLRNLRKAGHIEKIKPILAFYRKKEYLKTISIIQGFPTKKEQNKFNGNIAFCNFEDSNYFHDYDEVVNFIISEYENKQTEKLEIANNSSIQKRVCAICRDSKYPITNASFGNISKALFPGASNACYLVSHMNHEFFSYGFVGNENSNICENCGQLAVQGLSWLLGNQVKTRYVNKKTGKEIYKHKNRKLLINDYAANAGNVIVFWTKNLEDLPEMDSLDEPDDNTIQKLFESPTLGVKRDSDIQSDYFYSLFMTGGSRIIVRDWITLSTAQLKANIRKWFEDIELFDYYKNKNDYIGLKGIEQSILTPDERQKRVTKDKNSKVRDIVVRIQLELWRASILNEKIPIWILNKVVTRIQKDSYKLSSETKPTTNVGKENSESENQSDKNISFGFVFSRARIVLLKLIINRNLKQGERQIMSKLDEENEDFAYNWGRIFAVMASIQYKAFENDVNAGILEKNFANASKYPAQTIGRLSKAIRYYLTKIKRENFANNFSLESEYTRLYAEKIDGKNIPNYLSIEDQAKFTVGFYHQRNANISGAVEKIKEKKREDEMKQKEENLKQNQGEQK